MNEYLARKIFEQGVRVRNPTLFPLYESLKNSEWLSLDKLREIQLKNCAQFLRHAGENSPYYAEIFRTSGFDASSFDSFEYLERVPESSKDLLIEKNSKIHANNIKSKNLLAETSGTTGSALSFWRNEEWDSLNRATLMRSYDWYGVKPWQKNGYLWGYNISRSQALKVKLLDYMQNRFRLFSYSRDEIVQFAQKLTTSAFVSGYSSMIYEIAKVINELDLEKPRLNLVKGTSEMILDVYREESRRAFGCSIKSEYGAAESGLIAFECPDGNMHINIENVFLEKNSKGDLLVTNFASRSFPIIRYNIGDSVEMDDSQCPCGRAHPLLKDIVGRKGKKVVGYSGYYPALTFYYIFKNLALQNDLLINYKAIQRKEGVVVVMIEGRHNKQYENLVMEQFHKYFGSDMKAEIEYVDNFDLSRKKRQYFETELDQ